MAPVTSLQVCHFVRDMHCTVLHTKRSITITKSVSLKYAVFLQENYKQPVYDINGDANEEHPAVEDNEDSDQDVFGKKDTFVDPEIENLEKKLPTRVWEVNKRRKKGGKPAKKSSKQPVKKKKHEKKVCECVCVCVCVCVCGVYVWENE